MPLLTTATLNRIVETLDPSNTTGIHSLSLHTAYDTLGGSEVVGGSPPYARQPVTFQAASGGVKFYNPTVAFDVPASTTVSWVGLWDGSGTPQFLGMCPLGGNRLNLFVVVDTGLVWSPHHIFSNGLQVVVWRALGSTLPSDGIGNLSEGTIYTVQNTTTDTLQLYQANGVTPISFLTTGAGWLHLIQPTSFSAQSHFIMTTFGLFELAATLLT